MTPRRRGRRLPSPGRLSPTLPIEAGRADTQLARSRQVHRIRVRNIAAAELDAAGLAIRRRTMPKTAAASSNGGNVEGDEYGGVAREQTDGLRRTRGRALGWAGPQGSPPRARSHGPLLADNAVMPSRFGAARTLTAPVRRGSASFTIAQALPRPALSEHAWVHNSSPADVAVNDPEDTSGTASERGAQCL